MLEEESENRVYEALRKKTEIKLWGPKDFLPYAAL